MTRLDHDRLRKAGKRTESLNGDLSSELLAPPTPRPAWSRAYALRRAAEAQALIDAGKITVKTLPPVKTGGSQQSSRSQPKGP